MDYCKAFIDLYVQDIEQNPDVYKPYVRRDPLGAAQRVLGQLDQQVAKRLYAAQLREMEK